MIVSKIVDFAQFGYFIFINYKIGENITSLSNGELSPKRFICCLIFYLISDLFLIINTINTVRNKNFNCKFVNGIFVPAFNFLFISFFNLILKACEFTSFTPPYASLFMALGAVLFLIVQPLLWNYINITTDKYVLKKNALDFEIYEIKEDNFLYPSYRCSYKTELDGKEINLKEARNISPTNKLLIPKVGDKVKIGISKEDDKKRWFFDKFSYEETLLKMIRLCFFYGLFCLWLFLTILAI